MSAHSPPVDLRESFRRFWAAAAEVVPPSNAELRAMFTGDQESRGLQLNTLRY